MTATTGYAARAGHYADEIADVPAPDALHGLLGPGVRVAELPSASGHFLTTYAASGAATTLIDACPDMLEAAIVHADKLGVPRPQTICSRAQDLVPEHGPVDLIVVPNAALNQLATQTAPADVLAAARTILKPGGLLLAQILPPPGTAAADHSCGFYDPTQTDGHWVPDRELREGTGRPLTRRRRQHHDGALIHIDFELTRDGETTPRYRHSVELRLLPATEIYPAVAVAGLTVAGLGPGTGGLHEIIATRPAPEKPMTPQTIAGAEEYWDRYYSQEFTFGLGTEHIIEALLRVPPAGTWVDLGAGSESLLWSIPLRTDRLIAVDQDPHRLAQLLALAAARQPRPAYRTVLELSGRTPEDFAARCDRLTATVTADCLYGELELLNPASAQLVTQFGLLGLVPTQQEFLTAWRRIHGLLASDGWCAGANWNATTPTGRVSLTRQMYEQAFADTGITPELITRIPTNGDDDFDSVWLYLGRKR